MALYYDSDAYSSGSSDLLGRDAAGEGFVRALARHVPALPLVCLAQSQAHADALTAIVEPLRGLDSVEWVPMTEPGRLAGVGCLALPDGNLPFFAWQRRAVGQRSYALCGLAHAPLSAVVLRRVADMVTAPVQPWDALVCPSASVQKAIQAVLDEQETYLRERLGARPETRPMLPVIPLGIEPGDIVADDASRAAWRKRLGIPAGDFVVLGAGRISMQAKANPLPLFAAVEDLATRLGRRVHLLHAGFFATQGAEQVFRSEADAMAPSVNHLFVDGRDPVVRRSVWAAADAFVSLPDTVQETFPLATLEAMAAGLPVVAADWNGLKDVVRHGVDGFRVPTLLPPADSGMDIAARYMCAVDGYERFVAHAAMFAMVDGGAVAAALETLARNPDLRQSMGERGRKRVRDTFAWPVILRQYEELWRNQAKMRVGWEESAPLTPGRQVNPVYPDPFAAFASFPSRSIRLDDQVGMVDADGIDIYERLRVSPLVRHAGAALPADSLCRAILAVLLGGTWFKVGDVLAAIPSMRRRQALRALVWFGKIGIVRVEPAPPRQRP